MLEKVFKLKEHNTTVRTEIMAGLTTFFAMAYIIFVNPDMLSETGMDKGALTTVTCLAALIGCFLTGLLSNLPFAQAPGMGLNAFFTYTIVLKMGYTWEAALAAVFLSGALFILVTATNLRTKIVTSIPENIKHATSAGIGLFIAFIGLKSAGIIVTDPGSLLPGMGSVADPNFIIAFIGIVITLFLLIKNVKGAILIGIAASTVVALIMKITPLPTQFMSAPASIAPIFGKLSFSQLFKGDNLAEQILSVFMVVISLGMVNMFDTLGTLVGTATKAKMLDENGDVPKGDQALLADAISTMLGAIMGTSTVTTYVESSAGINEGGKTGLTAIVVGIMFALALFFGPIIGIVPAAATAPALIIVGAMMLTNVTNIKFEAIDDYVPAFFTIAFMPFAYSIADGMAMGFISHVICKVFARKFDEVNSVLVVITILFIIRYIINALFI